VYVSGSGPTLREEAAYVGGFLVSHGIALLAYDKRGVGESSGRFPGSLASESTISLLADDAVAAADFLAAQPEIDRSRVGLVGLSQGGWIIPLAAARAGPTISWAVIESGPAVTQGEADDYAGLARSGPIADAETQARADGPSGFDPAPWISQLTIPALWLYGSADRAQPPDTSIAILRGLIGAHDFAYELFPGAPHPLFDDSGFAPGLFPAVAAWLRAHGLAA
jgi:dienelactone hydrolase